jgi:hypothetical protein
MNKCKRKSSHARAQTHTNTYTHDALQQQVAVCVTLSYQWQDAVCDFLRKSNNPFKMTIQENKNKKKTQIIWNHETCHHQFEALHIIKIKQSTAAQMTMSFNIYLLI